MSDLVGLLSLAVNRTTWAFKTGTTAAQTTTTKRALDVKRVKTDPDKAPRQRAETDGERQTSGKWIDLKDLHGSRASNS